MDPARQLAALLLALAPRAGRARRRAPPRHLGTIRCVYDSPARYCVTVFRVSLTGFGLESGWNTERLCDEAFSHGGLTLAMCPRATMTAVPPVYSSLRRDAGRPR